MSDVKLALIDFDPFADAGAVPSPCISVCRMHPQSGLCEGCQRTIDEIVQWGTASESQKRGIWVEIHQRRIRAGLT
ncbi:MAG TPA: DUF1289 domain-containing protein [Burkholderiaceae bacterium]